jgi:hypothetical protein
MKNLHHLLILVFLLFLSSCITEFIPQTTKDKNIIVVEGLVTDKPEIYTIKVSKSNPLGSLTSSKPLRGCIVSVTDDTGNSFEFTETAEGTYTSDPAVFTGIIGRYYTLHVNTRSENNFLNYESLPAELTPVPPIDSIYYNKVVFSLGSDGQPSEEGAQIFLNTHDPGNLCKYYRWEYVETWEFHLPYMTPNNICWMSNTSGIINIKNVDLLGENVVERYPIDLVSNTSDRLTQRYSILVNQYSMNQSEYLYWEKLQNISEQVGGLYDMIPASIPSNIFCTNGPEENVLGYFSVSSHTSKRIFIKDNFRGLYNPFTDRTCIADTVWGPVNGPIYQLGTSQWVIISHPLPPPSYRVLTRTKGCYDCTVRGTNIKPDFWDTK